MSGKGNKSNGFWLDDDPEWEALRQRIDNHKVKKNKPQKSTKISRDRIRYAAKKQPDKPVYKKTELQPPKLPKSQPAPEKTEEKKEVNVSLKLTLPKITLPKANIKRRHLMYSGIVVATLVVGVGGFQAVKKFRSNDADPSGVLAETSEPEFNTVLPDGKAEETTSKHISYDSKKRVASFTDLIANVQVTISQQPLPEEFKDDPDSKVAALARDFYATEVIETANPTAYLGTSEKGPQTVIFHKKDLLVFIQSVRPIDKPDWAEYITKLN